MKMLSKKQKKKLSKVGRKLLKSAPGVTGIAAAFAAGRYGGRAGGYLATAGRCLFERVRGWTSGFRGRPAANGAMSGTSARGEVAPS
jgi:hypothetical protein